MRNVPYKEYDVIELRAPLAGLPMGARGTIVMLYQNDPVVCEVEFCNEEGGTIELLTLNESQIAPHVEKQKE